MNRAPVAAVPRSRWWLVIVFAVWAAAFGVGASPYLVPPADAATLPVTDAESEPTLTGGPPSPITVAVITVVAGALLGLAVAVALKERKPHRRRWIEPEAGGPTTWHLEPSDEPVHLSLQQEGRPNDSGGTFQTPRGIPDVQHLMAYRCILARILGPGSSIIGVAGSASYDGSGPTAVALAHAHASGGHRVVLMSLHVPPLASSADELDNGLHAVVHGQLPIDRALINLSSDGGDLQYLPPGAFEQPDQLVAHLGAIAELNRMLLSAGTDLIILELPPILSSVETAQLARLSGGLVLTSISGETVAKDIDEAAVRIRALRLPVLAEISHPEHVVRPIYVAAAEPPADDPAVDSIDLRVVNDGS